MSPGLIRFALTSVGFVSVSTLLPVARTILSQTGPLTSVLRPPTVVPDIGSIAPLVLPVSVRPPVVLLEW